jgi:hypothetical protein
MCFGNIKISYDTKALHHTPTIVMQDIDKKDF